MTLAESRRQIQQLAAMIVISSAVIVGISLFGFLSAHAAAIRDHRLIATIAAGSSLQQQTAKRTECVRAASAALDAARWGDIAKLFQVTTRTEARAIGEDLTHLPTLVALAEKGGVIAQVHLRACPASIVPPFGSASTSTSDG